MKHHIKRILAAFLALVLVLAVGLLAGTRLAPGPLRQAWSGVGLPVAVFDWWAELLDADIGFQATVFPHAAGRANLIEASGTIEAVEVRVAAEVGGRVAEVFVARGDSVAAGQLLVRLDDSLLRAQLQQAEKALETAQANLAAVRAGPTQAQISTAEAALRQAHAAWKGAWQAREDAQQARDNPQELDAQIHAAEARVALAGRQVEQARAQKAAVTALREGIMGDSSDQGKTQRAAYEKQEQAGDARIAAAQAELSGAQKALDYLRQMRRNPIALDVALRAAEGKLRLATEEVKVAQAALALAKAGPRPEEIALAEAQLAQAQAARDLVAAQIERYTLTSPITGVVTTRAIKAGEVVAAGTPLLTISDLSQVTLVIYVPESRIGQVRVGQEARVRVDAYPGRVFVGKVTYIAAQAEFTPKNIQTTEERVNTVFAVKITLDNADAALKPGMPADAELTPVG